MAFCELVSIAIALEYGKVIQVHLNGFPPLVHVVYVPCGKDERGFFLVITARIHTMSQVVGLIHERLDVWQNDYLYMLVMYIHVKELGYALTECLVINLIPFQLTHVAHPILQRQRPLMRPFKIPRADILGGVNVSEIP